MTLINDFVAGRSPATLYETYLVPGLFAPWADHLLGLVPPTGDCLDLACGTGIISRGIAARGTASSITAGDLAPPMLEIARAQAAAAGVGDKIEFQQVDALKPPFADQSFDRAYCQQGIQFFPDRVNALSEIKRMLRPDGRFVAAVWTAANDGNPVFGPLEAAIGRHFGEDLTPLGPFSFGDQNAFESVAREAGLQIESLERVTVEATLPAVRTLVLFDLLFLGRPAADGALMPVVDPDDPEGDQIVEALIDDLERTLSPLVQADGSLLTETTANVLVATR